MVDLFETCTKTINEYRMFDGAKKVCVAFSGGSDSSALLHFMYNYCQSNDIVLEAIHINHGIREQGAVRDEQFCIETCNSLGIYITHLSFDIPTLSKEWGMGEEEAGRQVRYAAFEQIMVERGIDKVCTAHHANDNAETVIFNISRGAGAKGMAGIPPVRDNIVRPLIKCTKEQINEYIKNNSIKFVDDETNSEDEYSRNYIRHNIIPPICKLNDSAIANISNASNLIREDDQYIYSVAEWYRSATITILKTLPNPVLSRVLILLTGSNHINLDVAMKAVREARPTKLSVGGSLMLVIEEDRLFFIPDEREKSKVEFCYELSQGVTQIPELDLFIYVGSEQYNGDGECIGEIKCNPKGKLLVRSRKEGDKLLWHGMNRHIKNLFQQCDVPSYERDNKLFICDDDGILWIPSVAQRDNQTQEEIYIQVLRRTTK